MAYKSNQIVAKGVFAIAAVALVGATTAAYAVTNTTNNSNSGYGGNETAIQASTKFDSEFTIYTAEFNRNISQMSDRARAQLDARGDAQVNQFETKFTNGTKDLDQTVAGASAKFRTDVAAALNSSQSKDQFIDAFNRAKAEYFNSLDAAKNDFAAVVSNFGHNSNVTKDQFIGSFNSSRDAYGNKLESAKNVFADRVNNS